MTNWKSRTRFRPWMTLKGHYAFSFKTRASFGAHHENLNEDRLYCQRRRCSAMTPDSGNIRITRIFAVILKIYVNFPDFMPTPVYYAFFVIKFNSFVYYSYLPMAAAASCKVRTSGDVASRLAKCDPQSIWNPRKNCGSLDATPTSSES